MTSDKNRANTPDATANDRRIQDIFGQHHFMNALQLLADAGNLLPQYESLLKRLMQRDVLDILSYQNVVDYFRQNCPYAAPSRVIGVLLRIDTITYDTLIQMYLNENNEPILDSKGTIHGRVIKFRTADSELHKTIDGQQLILFR